MGNLFGRSSAPPQLYARPAAAAIAPATEAEAAASANLERIESAIKEGKGGGKAAAKDKGKS